MVWPLLLTAGVWIGRAVATRLGTAAVTAGAGYVAGRVTQPAQPASKVEQTLGFKITPLNILLTGLGVFLLVKAVKALLKWVK